ncbi:MAG TPA: hypothetical protein VME92_06870 [Acetobacteraceae bacterium]|nr:hypothetical protein [Acetobacteraceae bacterium]
MFVPAKKSRPHHQYSFPSKETNLVGTGDALMSWPDIRATLATETGGERLSRTARCCELPVRKRSAARAAGGVVSADGACRAIKRRAAGVDLRQCRRQARFRQIHVDAARRQRRDGAASGREGYGGRREMPETSRLPEANSG